MKQFFGVRLALFKLLLVFIGIAMTVMSFGDAMAVWKKDIGKLYDKGRTEFNEDELVSGKIEYVLDPIAILVKQKTAYEIPVKKEKTPYYLCIVPGDEMAGIETYLLIVHATDKDTINSMDSLIFSTSFALDHLGEDVKSNKKPVALETKTRPIPAEVMDYALEYMRDGESTDEELKRLMADYMLEEVDYGTLKFEPLLGIVITLIPIIWIIISRRKAQAYKSSRTHYVNQGPADNYNTAPVPRAGASGQPMRRYSPDAYEAHTYAGGISPQQGGQPMQQSGRRYDPSAYGGSSGENLGEMDSIDTTNLKL